MSIWTTFVKIAFRWIIFWPPINIIFNGRLIKINKSYTKWSADEFWNSFLSDDTWKARKPGVTHDHTLIVYPPVMLCFYCRLYWLPEDNRWYAGYMSVQFQSYWSLSCKDMSMMYTDFSQNRERFEYVMYRGPWPNVSCFDSDLGNTQSIQTVSNI